MDEKISALCVGRIGQVISVHSRLINVLLMDGDLLAIHSGELIRTPMSLVIHWPEKVAAPIYSGTAVYKQTNPDRILCGPLAIDPTGTVPFSGDTQVSDLASVKSPLEILVRHFSQPDRIHSVYHFIHPAENKKHCTDMLEKQLGVQLQCGSQKLVEALCRRDAGDSAAAALRLVGLGPGMTPAGDDYLQGFFLFAQSDSAISPIVKKTCEFLRKAHPLDTTNISRAFWMHFLSGRVSEPVQQLVAAFNSRDWKAFSFRAGQISRIGHSSGDDYLSGIWHALDSFGVKS